MKAIQIFIIVLGLCSSVFSQRSVGIELRESWNITYNSSKIKGQNLGLGGYAVSNERNPTTSSYSVGLTYSPKSGSTFKLHLGIHQNGRIMDVTLYDDTGFTNYVNVDIPYSYLQFLPSYSYDIVKGNISVPIEFGIALNKGIKEADIFYIGVKEYNWDIRVSSGIQYKWNNYYLGCKAVCSKSLGNYLFPYIQGRYDPYQIGIELGVGYVFSEEK